MGDPPRLDLSRLARERADEFGRFVAEHHEGRWLVLTHDNPDPDALASAMVMGKLLESVYGVPAVTVAYGGIIGRAENREMVKTLRIALSHVRHLSWKHYVHFVLVDTQPRTGNNQLPEGTTPDVVIDHHPVRKQTERATYADVRPEYGATATIVAEYVTAAGGTLTKNEATALAYAIRTETGDFGRESSGPDRAAYDAILPLADKRALARIQSPRLPLSYFRTLHQALERLEGVENLVLCHLDEVGQPDIVPEIADLMLRLEGKTWALCTGRFEDRIYLSMRTTNVRADAGRLMHRLVGRRGRGGGHGMTAGGWVETKEPAQTQRALGERWVKELRRDPARISPIEL